MRWRCLDVHDDPDVQVDQVVGRVRVERPAARLSGPTRRRVLALLAWIDVVSVAYRVGLIERIQVPLRTARLAVVP